MSVMDSADSGVIVVLIYKIRMRGRNEAARLGTRQAGENISAGWRYAVTRWLEWELSGRD